MLAPRAAVEASAAALSNVSTPMPFLYQTKTLSSWGLMGASPVYGRQYQNVTLRKHFSTSIRAHINIRKTPDDAPEPDTPAPQSGLVIRRTTNISGPESSSAGNWKADQRPSNGIDLQKRKSPYASLSRRTAENDFDIQDEIGFDDDIDEDELFPNGLQRDEIQDLTRKHGARESTITEMERAAFQKIFSDIFERSKRSGSNLGPGLDIVSERSEHHGDELSMPDDMPKNQQNAKAKLDSILSLAMQRTTRSREEMEATIKRYPPALRGAAAKAMGFVEEEMESEEAHSSRGLLNTEQLETLRGPERARVEGLMNSARTDFELMDIMEKEVFSLIPKLGLDDTSKSDVAQPREVLPLVKGKKPKGWKKAQLKAQKVAGKEADGEPVNQEASLPNTPLPGETQNGVSPLALYGPLYPSYLLLGLRLLDRSFAKPSPIALTILPRIKSLGFISHVLGASTQLYNELLRIYRFRYDDFRGMLDLLNEMEHAALDFDEDTYLIVRDVAALQTAIHRGEKGKTIQALWAMPEFEPNGFRVWRQKISEALREKDQRPTTQYMV